MSNGANEKFFSRIFRCDGISWLISNGVNPHRGTDTAIVIAIANVVTAQLGLATAPVPVGVRHIVGRREISIYIVINRSIAPIIIYNLIGLLKILNGIH